jgi:hypothetical protein
MSQKRLLLVSTDVVSFLGGDESFQNYIHNKNVIVIPYDFNNVKTSYTELLKKIQMQYIDLKKGTTISSVALMFHNLNKDTLQCFKNDKIKSTIWGSPEDFEPFTTFVKTLGLLYSITDFDIISCDIVSNVSNNIFTKLDFGQVNVNASINAVGNNQDWILEYGKVDLLETYFKNTIVKTKLVLAKPPPQAMQEPQAAKQGPAKQGPAKQGPEQPVTNNIQLTMTEQKLIDAYKKMTATQIGKLTPKTIKSMTINQLMALTDVQLNAITPRQASYITLSGIISDDVYVFKEKLLDIIISNVKKKNYDFSKISDAHFKDNINGYNWKNEIKTVFTGIINYDIVVFGSNLRDLFQYTKITDTYSYYSRFKNISVSVLEICDLIAVYYIFIENITERESIDMGGAHSIKIWGDSAVKVGGR